MLRFFESALLLQQVAEKKPLAVSSVLSQKFPTYWVCLTHLQKQVTIEGKMLIVNEINVSSSLINLSGQGRVDLERNQIDGKGLIAVLKPIDEVISWIPGISSMLGGYLVGIPVRVTGELEHRS